MRKRLTTTAGVFAVVLLAFFVMACAGEGGRTAGGPMGTATSTPRTTTPGYAPAPTPTRTATATATTPTPYMTPVSSASQPWADRMIVQTANMSLVVQDVAGSVEAIADMAETFSGYVVSSKMWQQGQRTIGTIAIRVDVPYFNDAIKALRALAVAVTSENASGQDVTEEYVDLESRLRNLEATEQQLLKLMERAETVDEALTVQRELTIIQGEIEQTKGRMQYLERSSATSLIEVSLEQATLDLEFVASTTKINERDNVQFTSQVVGGFAPHTYEWSFGDGSTSAEANPSHVYEKVGSYTISLTIRDDKGNTVTKTRSEYVTVAARPGWSGSKVARGAWHGLVGFGHVLGDIAIWAGILGIIWVPVLALVYWGRRARRNRT